MSSLDESIRLVLLLAAVWLVPLVGFTCGLALDFGRARINDAPLLYIYVTVGLIVGLVVGIVAAILRNVMPKQPEVAPPERPAEESGSRRVGPE